MERFKEYSLPQDIACVGKATRVRKAVWQCPAQVL